MSKGSSYALLVIGCVVLCIRIWARKRRLARLPPGPTPFPLVGNVLDIPRTISAREYRRLSEKYGDIAYLKVLGQSMVVLDTFEAASELLDRRSSNYSDRPRLVMNDLIGGDWSIAFGQYNQTWRRRRKEFHRYFGSNVVNQYQCAQEVAAQRLVQDLHASPEAFPTHVRFAFGSTILRVVYGIEADSPEDEYILLEEEAQVINDKAFSPGRYLVEVLPFLRYIPSWFPGARFKRDAARWKVTLQETRNKPFDATLEQMRSGKFPRSIVSTMIDSAQQKGGLSAEEDALARDVTAMAYLGAVDTVVATFLTFLLAVATNPEVQQKAQAELDSVVGPTRKPTFADRDSLPYVNALLTECLRWKPTAQLGLPHCSIADDEYSGYTIPGGSLVIANVWSISRDPSHYPDPDSFMPERFLDLQGRLNTKILHPRKYAFGFGRRICPGIQFGEAALFIAIASVLHQLDIQPKRDELGRSTIPSAEHVRMKDSFLTHPESVEYEIRTRTKAEEGTPTPCI
ncbi:CyP450 monooxygenase [Fomes fomentarius]|nr:CyP450 monooxygenase [Fomes fomentarius]